MNRRSAKVPSLHHSKEGWPSDQENIAERPMTARPGWFSDRKTKGKPPRLRQTMDASRHFIYGAAPLLAVMQGGDFCTPAIHSQLLSRVFLGLDSGKRS